MAASSSLAEREEHPATAYRLKTCYVYAMENQSSHDSKVLGLRKCIVHMVRRYLDAGPYETNKSGKLEDNESIADGCSRWAAGIHPNTSFWRKLENFQF